MRAVKLTADISAKSSRKGDWRIPAFALSNEAGEIIQFYNTRLNGRRVMRAVKYNYEERAIETHVFTKKFDVLNFAQEQMDTYRFKIKQMTRKAKANA